jgi:hypothetical protein
MALHVNCPRCGQELAPDKIGPEGVRFCPGCGARFRLKQRSPAAGPGAESTQNHDEPRGASSGLPEPPGNRPKRRKTKGRRRKAGVVTPLYVGAGVGVTLLVLGLIAGVLWFRSSRKPGGQDGAGQTTTELTAADGKPVSEGGSLASCLLTFKEPIPPLPPPAERPAVAVPPVTNSPTVTAEDTLGFRTGSWGGKPVAITPPPPLPAKAFFHLRPQLGTDVPPLLASLGGPFLLEFAGKRTGLQDRPILGEDDARSEYAVLKVKDLRTGEDAGRFAWKTPLWAQPRLSPDAVYVVSPDYQEGCPATTREGLLFVWKREAAQPIGRLQVPGPVSWLDFVAKDKLAVLTFADTPVLQLWDVPAARLERTLAFPAGAFKPPTHDPYSNRPAAPGARTYAPDPNLGAVSPGGRYLALAGTTAVQIGLGRRPSRRRRERVGRLGRAEFPREQGAGHGHRGDAPGDVGPAARHLALGRCPFSARVPLALQLVQDQVQRQPRDELHDVVVQAVLLADPEDRHDVGVVQPGRRPRLALEAAQLP